jgi:NADH dehydrogenase
VNTQPQALPHIVVVGAGFAGLNFCKDFPRGLSRITVVDRTNHHLFQPLLYQVATAGLAVPDIAQPVRSILAKRPDITVLMDEVTGIDPAARRVTCRTSLLDYDYLIIAAGGQTSYFGHPEWEKHAPGLKTIEDAVRIRHDILGAFERAEAIDDPVEQRRLMTTVVIGGGPTGVELAGAFAELQSHVLAGDFRRVNPKIARVILVEGSPRVLGQYSEDLSAKALKQLEDLGVSVRLGTRVAEIREGEVDIQGGETIRAGNIIWAAGVSGSPLAAMLGVQPDRAGRVPVLPDLSIQGLPEILALGDMVTITSPDGSAVPGICPAAIQMGQHAARTLAREIRSRARDKEPAKREPFRYFDKGAMATIGRRRAIAQIRKLEVSGMLAWLMWLFVHLVFLIGFRNKISVLTSWTYSYITYKRGARVIYGGKPAQAGGEHHADIPSSQ